MHHSFIQLAVCLKQGNDDRTLTGMLSSKPISLLLAVFRGGGSLARCDGVMVLCCIACCVVFSGVVLCCVLFCCGVCVCVSCIVLSSCVLSFGSWACYLIVLGVSWEVLGQLLVFCGRFPRTLGRPGGRSLGRPWKGLGGLLGRLRRLLAGFGPSWLALGHLKPARSHLGPILARFAGILGS